MTDILNVFSDDKIIDFVSSRYRLKITINDLNFPFIILFQGFASTFCDKMDINHIDIDILGKLPNYMENTFNNEGKYNCVYVTDLYQLWGSIDFDSILKSLQNIVEYYQPKKTICIGQSAGGYMSILFGNLLNVDKILSFVPQINIYSTCMNQFRKKLVNKFKISNFKYKNLNVLQPFVTQTKIYICAWPDDIKHTNYLDKDDTNLIIHQVSNKHTHDITSAMGKNEYIKLIMNEISPN
jgi:hypothetical protein